MNIWLQMGIGVTAAALVMWLLFIIKKMRTVGRSVFAGIITAAGIALLVYGFLLKAPVEESGVSPLTQEEQVEFAYAFLEQGDYVLAQELMQEYSSKYGYDDTCSLFAARVELLQGNYDVAAGTYERLASDDTYAEQIAEEYELIQKKTKVNLSQAATVRYLKENGKNPADYGYSEDVITATEEGLLITNEMLQEAVFEGISKKYKTKNFKDTVQDVAEATRLYELCQTDYYGTPNEELEKEIEAVRKSLKKKMDDGESHCACVRNALLQMNLLLRDYEAIAENVNESATYVELMIVAELYMSDMVQSKAFKKTYLGALAEEMDRYSDVVGKKVNEVYKDNKKSLTDDEQEEMELLVEYWKIEAKHPILTCIRKMIETKAKENEVGTDASKVYLQLAKIAHFYENEKNRSSHLAIAINTGSDCEDNEYSEAMQKLYAIINGEGDINEVLNVSDYVERALERAMPDGMDIFLKEDSGLQLYATETNSGGTDARPKQGKEFFEVFEEYVNKTRSAVNISEVDTESFETIKVRVAVSSDYAETAEKLSKIMKISDCGFEIEDFKIEKLEYTEGRTHLACDVSGSMDGYIGDLRQAVTAYINGRNPKEKLAISTFSDYIEDTMPFGSSKEELLNFANGFYASGGTSIYGTIIQILNGFDSTVYSNNAIILMTDGMDGSTASDSAIARDLANLAAEKNVKVYTIGLGSVNAEYLTKIAEAGGGVFVHTREGDGLDALYGFLQGQVDNQYIVTFKAKDTLTARNRLLEISVNNGEAKSDFVYSLAIGTNAGNNGNNGGNGDNGGNGGNNGGNAGNNSGNNGGNAGNTGSLGTGTLEVEEKEEVLPVSTLRLSNLEVRKIYKSNIGTANSVITFDPAFTKDMMMASIRFIKTDEQNYQQVVALTYKDSCTATFTIPASLKVGTYDVEVSVNGKKGYLRQALQIATPKVSAVYEFGDYKFTAHTMSTASNGKITLSGDVVMNGWLQFEGWISIEPDPDDSSYIKVTDKCGSKVEFNTVTATGLGKRMANQGLPVYVPAMGTFKLYNDPIHAISSADYITTPVYVVDLYVAKLLCAPAVEIRLFPDRMEMSYTEVQTKLPFQEALFGSDNTKKYNVDWNERKAVLTGENLGIVIEYESERNEDYPVLNTVVNVNELAFTINTIDDEYSFGIMMKMLAFPECGAKIALKGGDLDSCSVTCNAPKTVTFGTVAITFSKFTLGAEGGDIGQKLSQKRFGEITYIGAMDISTASVTDILPKMKKYYKKDPPALLKMPQTKIALTPSPFAFSTTATLELLETVELAKASIEIGNIEYENVLLGIDKAKTFGVSAALSPGFTWEKDDAINLSVGAAGTLNVHDLFTGVGVENAHVTAKLEWWIFDYNVNWDANMLMGMTQAKSGGAQFNVVFTYQDGTKAKKDWFYINGKEGVEVKHS